MQQGEIGLKATGNGMIAITNWHLLAEGEVLDDDRGRRGGLGAPLDPHLVVGAVLPLTPGRDGQQPGCWTAAGRAAMCWSFWNLPELMVFNDEAHHIHEFKREGETTEVEWQKSLRRIAATKGGALCRWTFRPRRTTTWAAAKQTQAVLSRTSWWTSI